MGNSLSLERLKYFLNYDPATGVFTWRSAGSRRSAGKVAGAKCPTGYIQIGIDGKTYLGHRLAWFYIHGEWPKNYIDHINWVRDDNRIVNLRDVTQAENMQNRAAPNRDSFHKVMGVTRSRRSCKAPYCANISANGKRIYLGSFQTIEAAGIAYMEAKRKLHPTATINFTKEQTP